MTKQYSNLKSTEFQTNTVWSLYLGYWLLPPEKGGQSSPHVIVVVDRCLNGLFLFVFGVALCLLRGTHYLFRPLRLPTSADRCRRHVLVLLGPEPLGATEKRCTHPAFWEASRNHGHAYSAFLQARIGDSAKDDFRVGIDGLGNDIRGILHLQHAKVLASSDGEKNSLRAMYRDFQEGRVYRGAGCELGTLLADTRANPHESTAGVLHDRAHVGKVDVDYTRLRNEVGNSFDCLLQYFVAHRKRVLDAGFARDDGEELVVGDDDECVHGFAEFRKPLFGEPSALRSLKAERLRDDADGERAELASDFRDDRCSAGSRAAAHTASDEHHVGTFYGVLYFFPRLVGRLFADVGVHSGAQSSRQSFTDVYLSLRFVLVKVLAVGVDRDEVDSLHVRGNHVIDRMSPRTPDPDDPYPCERFNIGLY